MPLFSVFVTPFGKHWAQLQNFILNSNIYSLQESSELFAMQVQVLV